VLAAGHSKRIAERAQGRPSRSSHPGHADHWTNLRWRRARRAVGLGETCTIAGPRARALGDGNGRGVCGSSYSESPRSRTAGAARKLLTSLTDPFVVVYGDQPRGFDLTAMRMCPSRRQADVTIALFDDAVPNTGIAGGRVRVNADGAVAEFLEELPPGPRRTLRECRVYAARRKLLRAWARIVCGLGPRTSSRGFARRARQRAGYPITGFCLGLIRRVI